MEPPTVRDIKTALREIGEFLNKINLHYRKSTTALWSGIDGRRCRCDSGAD
jgi:hypothetical protein